MKVSIEGQGHFLTLFFSGFVCVCAYSRPRYQVSVYRTLGPLVYIFSSDHLLQISIIQHTFYERKIRNNSILPKLSTLSVRFPDMRNICIFPLIFCKYLSGFFVCVFFDEFFYAYELSCDI